jgi:hypothetical protein
MGSTFIAESDRSKVAAVREPDDLDQVTHVHLDGMITLDFEEALGTAGVTWTDGEPLHFNEEEGVALFKVNETALAHLLEHVADFPEEHRADVQKLVAFVTQHGIANIYEYAAF